MIIDEIKKFIKKCPFLKSGRINVDYLSDKPNQYTIDSYPADPIIKRYSDGGQLKQFLFLFGSREYYDENTLQNIENNAFYEMFSDWLEEQNKVGNLPVLGNKESQRIEALSTGYIQDSETNNARYQIQCRLIYYQAAK